MIKKYKTSKKQIFTEKNLLFMLCMICKSFWRVQDWCFEHMNITVVELFLKRSSHIDINSVFVTFYLDPRIQRQSKPTARRKWSST